MPAIMQVNDLACDVSWAGKQQLKCLLNFIFGCPSSSRDIFDEVSLGFPIGGGRIAPSANPLTMIFGQSETANDLVMAASAALLIVWGK